MYFEDKRSRDETIRADLFRYTGKWFAKKEGTAVQA